MPEWEPTYPASNEVTELHGASMEAGGQPQFPLLYPERLEGALGRAPNYWHYGAGSQDERIADAAGAMAHGIGMAQSFENGNKRAAYHTTRYFLHNNGYGYISPVDFDDTELADHLIGHGEGTHSLEDTQNLFRNRLRPKTLSSWKGDPEWDGDPKQTKSAKLVNIPHYNEWTGEVCHCPWHKPYKLHLRKVGGQNLNKVLKAPDKAYRTPEGEQFREALKNNLDEEHDALAPFIAQRWKKGEIKVHPLLNSLLTEGWPFALQNGWDTDQVRFQKGLGPLASRYLSARLPAWNQWFQARQHPTRRGVNVMDPNFTVHDMEAKAREHQEALERERQIKENLQHGDVVHTFPGHPGGIDWDAAHDYYSYDPQSVRNLQILQEGLSYPDPYVDPDVDPDDTEQQQFRHQELEDFHDDLTEKFHEPPREKGWHVRHLTSPGTDTDKALTGEGHAMSHCLGNPGQPYLNCARQGNIDVYSLRDPRGWPHGTWHTNNSDHSIAEVFGHSDKSLSPAHQRMYEEWCRNNDYDPEAVGHQEEAEDAQIELPAADDVDSYLDLHGDEGNWSEYIPDDANYGENTEILFQHPEFSGIAKDMYHGNDPNRPRYQKATPAERQTVYNTAVNNSHVHDLNAAMMDYPIDKPWEQEVRNEWLQRMQPHYHPFTGELQNEPVLPQYQNQLFQPNMEGPWYNKTQNEANPWNYDYGTFSKTKWSYGPVNDILDNVSAEPAASFQKLEQCPKCHMKHWPGSSCPPAQESAVQHDPIADLGESWAEQKQKWDHRDPNEIHSSLDKEAVMTLPQQQRFWQKVNDPNGRQPVHQFNNGYSIQQHLTPQSAQGVGSFMRNCWQDSQTAANWNEAHDNGYKYYSLHDENDLPRMAFFTHENPWSSRQEGRITQPLGARNQPIDPQHLNYLQNFADANWLDMPNWIATKEEPADTPLENMRGTLGEPTPAGRLSAWHDDEGFSQYTTPFANWMSVAYDENPSGINVYDINVLPQHRNRGYGSKFMDMAKYYADQNQVPLNISRATNHPFFRKFDWLNQTGPDSYSYAPSVEKAGNFSPYDPVVCSSCGGAMTEPYPQGNKMVNKCTSCGLSRIVQTDSPLFQNMKWDFPQYPSDLQEIYQERNRPWIFSGYYDTNYQCPSCELPVFPAGHRGFTPQDATGYKSYNWQCPNCGADWKSLKDRPLPLGSAKVASSDVHPNINTGLPCHCGFDYTKWKHQEHNKFFTDEDAHESGKQKFRREQKFFTSPEQHELRKALYQRRAQAKVSAADPAWWNDVLQREVDPYFYHKTHVRGAQDILTHGLFPYDAAENGTGTTYEGDITPRPGHIYLAKRDMMGQVRNDLDNYGNAVVLRIRKDMLRPENLNADEDHYAFAGGVGDKTSNPMPDVSWSGDLKKVIPRPAYKELVQWRNSKPQDDYTLPADYYESQIRPRYPQSWPSYGEWANDQLNEPHHTQASYEYSGTIAHRGAIPPEAITVEDPGFLDTDDHPEWFERSPTTSKTAAIDPDYLNQWIQENGPYLYHGTSDDAVQRILNEGLYPHDHGPDIWGRYVCPDCGRKTHEAWVDSHGFQCKYCDGPINDEDYVPPTRSKWEAPLRPRSNHAYMGTLQKASNFGSKLLQIDLRKLNPNKITADEDAFSSTAVNHAGARNHPIVQKVWEYDHPPDLGDPDSQSLGDWADQINLGDTEPEETHFSLDSHGTVAHRGVIPSEALSLYQPPDYVQVNPDTWITPEMQEKAKQNLGDRFAKNAGWHDYFLNQVHPIAKAYESLTDYDPHAVNAWQELAEDSRLRADELRRKLNISVTDHPEPYANASEMFKDIDRGNFQVSSANCEHPIWTPDQNVNFRIVHDLLGHYPTGGDFGWAGENLACGNHFQLLSPDAQQALMTECLGQTGYAIANGGFGPQKVGFMNQLLGPAQQANQTFSAIKMPPNGFCHRHIRHGIYRLGSSPRHHASWQRFSVEMPWGQDFDEWQAEKPAYDASGHQLGYNPDKHTEGKGFILNDGSVWTWPTYQYRPVHTAYNLKVKNNGQQTVPGSAFHIDNAQVFSWQGRSLTPEQQQQIQDADPRLTIKENQAPPPDTNQFGHGKSILDILDAQEQNRQSVWHGVGKDQIWDFESPLTQMLQTLGHDNRSKNFDYQDSTLVAQRESIHAKAFDLYQQIVPNEYDEASTPSNYLSSNRDNSQEHWEVHRGDSAQISQYKVGPRSEAPAWHFAESQNLGPYNDYSILSSIEKTADKLHDFLMNPKSRPDLQTPEGQAFLRHLEHFYHNDKTDAMMPWLTREWKKGRVGYEPDPMDAEDAALNNRPLGSDYTPGLRYYPRGYNTTLQPVMLNHWADFNKSNHPVRRQMGDIMQHDIHSYQDQIKQWDEAMVQEAHDKALAGGQVVHTTPQNWTIRNLTQPEELQAEGEAMAHCIGGYDQAVANGDSLIYSLRDPQGRPHSTIEIEPQRWQDPSHEGRPGKIWGRDAGHENPEFGMKPVPHNGNIVQIQGKGNREPLPEYKQQIADWFGSFPEEDRPRWADTDYYGDDDLDYPHEIYPHHFDVDAKDEYGLAKPPLRVNWDRMVPNTMVPTRHDESTYDAGDGQLVYDLAKAHGKIPQLGSAVSDFSQEQYDQLDYLKDRNIEQAPWYPDESAFENEDGSFNEEGYAQAMKQYEEEEREFENQFPGIQAANHFNEMLQPHWHPETQKYENEIYQPPVAHSPTTFSKRKTAQPQYLMGPGTMYHVSPRKNRESILQHGLQGYNREELESPWNYTWDQPAGNYLFDNPEDAQDYARNLHNRTGNPETDWEDRDTYNHPIGFHHWEPHEQDQWYDDNEPQERTEDPNGYDIYRVHAHGMPIVPDPESRTIGQGDNPGRSGPWDIGRIHDIENEEATDPWGNPQDISDWGDEPRRYLIPQDIHPSKIQLHQHVPSWNLTENDPDDEDYGERSYPQPWAQIPFAERPFPGHESSKVAV